MVVPLFMLIRQGVMMDLILIRGLPGSGKSTLADKFTMFDYVHIETDMYWDILGNKFDPRQLKSAHNWCQNRTRQLLIDNYNVVVANTFTQRWEMQPYFDMADTYNATLQIIECKGNFKSIHNVPQHTINKMRIRWEEVN